MFKQKINECNGINVIRNREFFVCTNCNLRYPIYSFEENNDQIIINIRCKCKTYSKTLSQILEKRRNIVVRKCCISGFHFNDILYCIKCEKWFCKECRGVHDQLAKTDEFYLSREDDENHILSNTHCFIDKEIRFNVNCSSHFFPLIFYCKRKDDYFCEYCSKKGHENCAHVNIKSKWEKEFEQSTKKSLITKISDLKHNFSKYIESLNKSVEDKSGSLTRKSLHHVLSEVKESVENKTAIISAVVSRIIDDLEFIKEHNIYNVYFYETCLKNFNFNKPENPILQDKNEINIHKIFALKKCLLVEVQRKEVIEKYHSFEVSKIYCLLQFNSECLITGEDNVFQLWKGIYPVSIGKVNAHRGKVLCIEQINVNIFYTSGEDGCLCGWIFSEVEILNKNTNKKEKKNRIAMIARYKNHKYGVKSILKMKGSNNVVTMDNESIIILDCNPLNCYLTKITYLLINCNQNILAQINENSFCFSSRGTIQINNIKSFFELKASYDLHRKNITCIVKLDAEYYASGSEDTFIILWDIYFQKKKIFDKHKDAIVSIVHYNKQYKKEIVSLSKDGQLYIWNYLTLDISYEHKFSERPFAMTFRDQTLVVLFEKTIELLHLV